MKSVTHLHGWQFFDLAARLQPLIDRPKLRKDGTRPVVNLRKKTKADHYHRLYYCLKWLNDGNFFRTREAETGLDKSTIHEDTVHVLEALVEGLDDQLQWPDSPYWVTISASYRIQTEYCSLQFMLQSGYIIIL
jgi:hypothetical protein